MMMQKSCKVVKVKVGSTALQFACVSLALTADWPADCGMGRYTGYLDSGFSCPSPLFSRFSIFIWCVIQRQHRDM